MNQIGYWNFDEKGLPCFEYTGKLPYQAPIVKGEQIKLPNDPFFLLGNYRLTMFSHVSGTYELLSGQREWARLNQKADDISGNNTASVHVNSASYSLVGMDSLAADPNHCRRIHGCGFAYFCYEVDGIIVERNLSVKPSVNPQDGCSAFLLTVTFKNKSATEKKVSYQEGVEANYVPLHTGDRKIPVEYRYQYISEKQISKIEISAISDDPLLFRGRDEMSVYECYPPVLFMKTLSDQITVLGTEKKLGASFQTVLQAGEEATVQMVIGFAHDDINLVCKALENQTFANGPVSAFAKEWKNILPEFPNEQDSALRRELRWDAYVLETMATYSEYYGETKIPQGMGYDYLAGMHASARDNFQHMLPVVYYNQPLAKSILRYMMKRMMPTGEVTLIEYENGWASNGKYRTSDQQLYFFLALSEYLRVTRDYAFLNETVTPFPVKDMAEMKIWKLVQNCFLFLRDEINTGKHGLIRLLNSDWNDCVYRMIPVPYNKVCALGESHMNSAMAISILQNLIPQLEAAGMPELQPLCESMKIYRKRILSAFLSDLGDRTFPRRMYFNEESYGDDNMFLEPQGFTLQIAELSVERKRQLYEEMKRRVYDGEKIGAREQQKPQFASVQYCRAGSRENGGFWWALNGPIVIGVLDFDPEEANRLLQNMTLRNISEKFPQYWSSYWSSTDSLGSSLVAEEGCVALDFSTMMPVFCAHPHAWGLYCYYRLHD